LLHDFVLRNLMDHQVYYRFTQTNGVPQESKLANYMVTYIICLTRCDTSFFCRTYKTQVQTIYIRLSKAN
jgi:hypothetical protein